MDISPVLNPSEWESNLALLPKLPELDSIFQRTMDEIFISNSFSDIKEIYDKNIGMIPFLGMLASSDFLKKYPIFRVRSNVGPNESLNLISTFSYPPPHFTKKLRANIDNSPVFYGSDHPLTAIREAKIENDDELAYLTIWEVDCSRDSIILCYLPDNLSPSNPAFPLASLINRNFVDITSSFGQNKKQELFFLRDRIIKSFLIENNNYNFTSFLAHMNLYMSDKFDMIMYQSIVDYQKSSCFAIHPNYAHRFLKLKQLYSFYFTEKQYYINLRSVGRPNKSNIVWESPTQHDKDVFYRFLYPNT